MAPRADSNFLCDRHKTMARQEGGPSGFRLTSDLVDYYADAWRSIRRRGCCAADNQLVRSQIKSRSLRTKRSIVVAYLIGSGIRDERIGRNHRNACVLCRTCCVQVQITAAAIYKLRVRIQITGSLRWANAHAEPQVVIAPDLAHAAIHVN